MESKVRKRNGTLKNSAAGKVEHVKEDLSEESAKENKRFQYVNDDDDNEPVEKEIPRRNSMKPDSQKKEIKSTKSLKVDLPKFSLKSLDLSFKLTVEYDLITFGLFLVAFLTRTYKLWLPNNIV